MKKAITSIGLTIALSACTASCSFVSGDGLKALQADLVPAIQAACQDVGAVATLPGVDPNIKVYADAACPLGIAAAGLIVNSQTLQWLGKLQGQMAQSAAAPTG